MIKLENGLFRVTWLSKTGKLQSLTFLKELDAKEWEYNHLVVQRNRDVRKALPEIGGYEELPKQQTVYNSTIPESQYKVTVLEADNANNSWDRACMKVKREARARRV